MLTPEQEAEAERRQHFILKQLVFFWPMVDNADDADRVQHLNYWLCASYAGWNLISGILLFVFHATELSPAPILLLVSFVIFYFLGANAVRQNSVSAAWAMVAALVAALAEEVLNRGKVNPTSVLFLLGGLVVLRGTFLTARWHRTRTANSVPLRVADILPLQFSTGFSRSFSDRLPPKLWPSLQWLFWLTAVVIVAEPIVLAVLIAKARQP